MPQDSSSTSARQSFGTSESTAAQAPNPNHPPPPVALWGVGVLAIAVAAALAYRMRTSAIRTWQRYAGEINGEFAAKSRFAPSYVSGELSGRAVFMETATNNDDDAPYYHTRVSTPISNPGQLVLGLRRKSMLEEAQTRNEKPVYAFGDTDFDQRFYLVANDSSVLSELISADVRKRLLKYSDIEIYIGMTVAEWRRSGEVSDLHSIRWLNSALVELAEKLEKLPRRSISLSQRLADEELIRKSI